MPKGKVKTGTYLPCPICQAQVYYEPLQIKRGIKKTCGKPDCRSAAVSGSNNPFWGKQHTPETVAKIKSHPPHNRGGPPKDWTHTTEARKRISEATRERWRTNRDKMIAQLPRGEDHPYRKGGLRKREGLYFTPWQRRNWVGTECFYCLETSDLVLDHIIPVMAGGKNLKHNSQTLCRKCNLWKMRYVDLPYYQATLGTSGG